MENLETLRKRLLYQSQHRGMREMDFILGRFARNHLSSLSFEELKLFEGLLAFPDQTLYACFFERVSFSSPEFNPIIDAILTGFQVTGQAPEGEISERILIRDRERDSTGNAPGT